MAHFASAAKYSDVFFICVYGKDVKLKKKLSKNYR